MQGVSNPSSKKWGGHITVPIAKVGMDMSEQAVLDMSHKANVAMLHSSDESDEEWEAALSRNKAPTKEELLHEKEVAPALSASRREQADSPRYAHGIAPTLSASRREQALLHHRALSQPLPAEHPARLRHGHHVHQEARTHVVPQSSAPQRTGSRDAPGPLSLQNMSSAPQPAAPQRTTMAEVPVRPPPQQNQIFFAFDDSSRDFGTTLHVAASMFLRGEITEATNTWAPGER